MLEFLEDIGELLFSSKRLNAMKHFATAKGFSWKRKVDAGRLPLDVQRMAFYEGTKRKSLKGYLHKKELANAVSSSIFDYHYAHDFGARTTTIFLYKTGLLDLPSFSIRPRASISKIGHFFSSTEWSEVNKDFDREFVVDSEDDNEMRMMITIQFAEVMLELKGYELEGIGDFLALYKKNSTIDIIDMDNVHYSALELIDIIINDHSKELI